MNSQNIPSNAIKTIYLPYTSNGIYIYNVTYNIKKIMILLTKLNKELKRKDGDISIKKQLTIELKKSLDIDNKHNNINLSNLISYIEDKECLFHIKECISLLTINKIPNKVETLSEKDKEWRETARNIAKRNNKQYYQFLDEKRNEFCKKREIAFKNQKVLKKM